MRHLLLPLAAAAGGVHRAGGLVDGIRKTIDAFRLRPFPLPTQHLRILGVRGDQPAVLAACGVEGPTHIDRNLGRERDLARDASGEVKRDEGGPAGVEEQDGCGHGGQV